VCRHREIWPIKFAAMSMAKLRRMQGVLSYWERTPEPHPGSLSRGPRNNRLTTAILRQMSFHVKNKQDITPCLCRSFY
jgi:hypothetical protein